MTARILDGKKVPADRFDGLTRGEVTGCNPQIDDLLVALTRAGKLTPRDMTKLVVAHHRSLASV